ncbi:TetR/AcrR family transcriptional regulator [Mycobacterium avium subsp. hominissuis]|uniref:TetR/AcrR family transcriptional regulator n=6 Tax=Mycobacterium avium TaxID=1764 RepID=A0A2A3L7H4_MYCAV|nr:TetR/AcrR family transcriptional regulator [Mycobacterium avium]APA73839.1 TetR/AcrR family transcriptional regulator [Mycobacterium avium subsp. hominissuis]AXO21150.1 TetR/AcrR family transcriptional regulator [Mycobacterium avium subsp. hominissuis]ETZ51642.1 bacterial regulatory s, tetR family protein [Mycobacterium avium MAV_120709_2344]MBG0730261.1 TetR/AcrR family transcriptional regulator [Mycobacterium avium]MCA2338479.1 TetR/AcrR family transcriptional regulator [Mycobacterium avi
MARDDWLVGRDRRSAAAERIYASAADLIARRGYDGFTIEALAARVHCSPATIYRHAGGKATIRDAVVGIQAARIVDTTREAIKDLRGPERVVTATIMALERLRSDPLAQLMRSIHAAPVSDWVINSPTVTALAAEMLGPGHDDPLAAQWLIHVFLALWGWPLKDPAAERALVHRFLGASYRPGGERDSICGAVQSRLMGDISMSVDP